MSHDPEVNNTTITLHDRDAVIVRTTFMWEAETEVSGQLLMEAEIKAWQQAANQNHTQLVAKIQNWLGEVV